MPLESKASEGAPPEEDITAGGEGAAEAASSWQAIVQKPADEAEASSEEYVPRYPHDPLLDVDIWRRGGEIIQRTSHNRGGSKEADDPVSMRGEAILYKLFTYQPGSQRGLTAPPAPNLEPGTTHQPWDSQNRAVSPVVMDSEIVLQGFVVLAEGTREYHVHYQIPVEGAIGNMSRGVIHRLLRDLELSGRKPVEEYADKFFQEELPEFLVGYEYMGDPNREMTQEERDAQMEEAARMEIPAQTFAEMAEAESVGNDLVNKHRESLAIIQGKQGAGSAFLCRWNGEPFLVSNIHVVAGDQTGKAITLYKAPLPVEEAWAAVGHDILRFKARESDKITLEVIEDFDNTVKVGDDIVVLGNPEGAGVVQPLAGRILGVGPDRVEVDAQFVPGNSGSPIIHVPTGKVIAIATYIRIRDRTFLDEERKSGMPVTQEFRRFGYRLDSVTEWQPINWPVFFAQAAQVASVEQLSMDMIKLLQALGSQEGVSVYEHRNAAIKDHVRSYVQQMNENPRMSRGDRHKLAVRFISNLKSASTSDLPQLQSQRLYDYFETIVDQEAKLRGLLVDDFDSWLRLNVR